MKKELILITAVGLVTTMQALAQTTNYVAKFNSSGATVNSNIFDNGSVGIGTAPYTLHSSSALFPSVTSKFEVLTGSSVDAYSELVTIRHNGIGPAASTRQLGLVLKLSNEDNAAESNKMGGLLLESLAPNLYSNSPSLSFLTANQRRLTVAFDGKIGIGTTSPLNKFMVLGNANNVPVASWLNGASPVATFFGEYNAGNADLVLALAGTSSIGDRPVYHGRRSRGTLSVPAAVQASDYLGSFIGSGHDGTNFVNTAEMAFVVDGTVSTGAIPTAILFNTSSSAASGRIERMRITSGGNIGIGISNPAEKLAVNGTIRSKEIKVETVNWPDFVFNKKYPLPSLPEVEAYVDKYKHLPEVPTADEVEKNGQSLGEMNRILLKKVEELTLYLIEQNKRIEQLEKDKKMAVKE